MASYQGTRIEISSCVKKLRRAKSSEWEWKTALILKIGAGLLIFLAQKVFAADAIMMGF